MNFFTCMELKLHKINYFGKKFKEDLFFLNKDPFKTYLPK